ncbi:leucine--tRNA ligase [Candidatus Pacearchaeota archaeon]|nr:leucine--tRNA ligase [Candidatus Pacearchaeota archaeon]
MKEINFKKIEKKWQTRWEAEKIFEADSSKGKKFFVSFPYPYVNAYSHIGHFYTIMRVEAMARYKRLKGFNVLFAQGWHATGSPILNAAKRVKDKEEKQLKIMKDMGITGSKLKKFEKPEYWVEFFVPEFKKDYQMMGMSVDWRREFITTSLNKYYDKFIEWQFRKLRKKGYCIKGKFPVVWDPKENVAVGDHARIEGEGETTQDFIWIKFRMKDSDLILMAGTTRPDALYGQTHVWIDPKGEYVILKVGEEKWVVGKDVVDKIKYQYGDDFKFIRSIDPKELFGKWVRGPLFNKDITVIPADFIKSNVGSGIVYSALEDPVDLYELKKIQSDLSLVKDYGLDMNEVKRLKPIHIIDVSGMGSNLGESIGEEFGVKSAKDIGLIEKAKSELNKRVFRKGIMRKNCGKCSGLSVSKAQEYLKKILVKNNDAVMFYELTGKVVSRTLTECVVKIVDNQWFLDYNNPKWKKLTHECLKNVKLYPEKSRSQFEYVIDWLHEWACTREEGLGTKLPWDKKWLIESLSDSTIYMAYYTIAHLIENVPISKVNDELFDYLFLDKKTKLGIKGIDEMKKEFEYWYPHDFRNSGKDLIQNHLTFYLFNHVAIFPKKYLPKGIGVNGWVTVDGQKMSKSLGNMIPVREMADKFGADVSRLTILSGGEGMDDPNWDSNFALSLKTKFSQIIELIEKNYGNGRKDINNFDKLIESQSNRLIKESSSLMDESLYRSAIQKIFVEYFRIVKDYLNIGTPNKKVFCGVVEKFIIMFGVFCPHICEELWEKIGKKSRVSLEKWPRHEESKIDEKLEKEAEGVNRTVSDIMNILKILKEKQDKECEKVYLYVIPNEIDSYNEKVLAKRIQKSVKIFAVNDKNKYDPEGKSKKAKPGKPGIFVE